MNDERTIVAHYKKDGATDPEVILLKESEFLAGAKAVKTQGIVFIIAGLFIAILVPPVTLFIGGGILAYGIYQIKKSGKLVNIIKAATKTYSESIGVDLKR